MRNVRIALIAGVAMFAITSVASAQTVVASPGATVHSTDNVTMASPTQSIENSIGLSGATANGNDLVNTVIQGPSTATVGNVSATNGYSNIDARVNGGNITGGTLNGGDSVVTGGDSVVYGGSSTSYAGPANSTASTVGGTALTSSGPANTNSGDLNLSTGSVGDSTSNSSSYSGVEGSGNSSVGNVSSGVGEVSPTQSTNINWTEQRRPVNTAMSGIVTHSSDDLCFTSGQAGVQFFKWAANMAIPVPSKFCRDFKTDKNLQNKVFSIIQYSQHASNPKLWVDMALEALFTGDNMRDVYLRRVGAPQ